MTNIKRVLIAIVICSSNNITLAQNIKMDSISWKQYIRGGLVQVSKDKGVSGYYRINRTCNYNFGDLRLSLYSVKSNS